MIEKMPAMAATPPTAIPAMAPVPKAVPWSLATAAAVVVAASGFDLVVLEDVEDTMLDRVADTAVDKAAGVVAEGEGADVTIEGDPDAVAIVDNAGVVDGLAIDMGSVDVTAVIGASVAVIVAIVSGTEPTIPAQMLYTAASELVEAQFDTTHCKAASPSANLDGFGVTQRKVSDDVFAQLVLYSVTMKLSTQLIAQVGTVSTTSVGMQELCRSFRARFSRLGVHDD
jgi:hypothetical protein